ncbi:MAG: hypothetical protein ACKOWJ_06250, partial [Micrococcales bacterium]
MRKFRILAAIAAFFLSTTLTSAPSTAADLVVPKTSFAICDTTHLTYCIESVSIQAIGGAAEPLTFTPSGTAITGIAPTVPSATPGVAGSATLAGTWSSATWGANGHADAGYDGIYIDAKAANQYTNFLFVNVRPVKLDPSNIAKNSVIAAGSTNASSLNANEAVTMKIRTGLFQSGVSIAIASSSTVTAGSDINGTNLTITAYPTEVPVAASTAACTGDAGVAVHKTNQLMMTFAPVNDPTSGFGVDGVSGGMSVSTNGACLASTPVWDAANSVLTWSVAAPHFAPDGTTVNKGFYKAVIPVNDAALLWGLTDPKKAAQALTVSVTDDNGTPSTAINSISVKNNKILIEASGFHYSKPTIKIKKNTKFTGFAVKKLLTCKKASSTIKFKGYVCPTGYTKG